MTTLFAFGSNGSGQLGLGHLQDVSSPEKVQFPDSFDERQTPHNLQVSCGGNHTIIVDRAQGIVYGAGSNESHQLGLETLSQHNTFTKLSNEYDKTVRWVMAATTWETSVLVDDEGSIYTCGIGQHGELGDEKSNKRKVNKQFTKIETRLSSLPVKAAGGLRHIVMLCDSGDVWGWGANRKGQVGLADGSSTHVQLPHKLASGIRDIGCGKDFTVLLHRRNNKIEILGNQRQFKADFYSFISQLDQEVGPAKVESLSVGWTSIHLMISKQERQIIESFGNDSHGQLYTTQESGPTFTSIAAGTEHYLATERAPDSTVNVLSWGWGEHGNCGPEYKEPEKCRLYTVANYSQIGPNSNIQLFGGYSSSWILSSE